MNTFLVWSTIIVLYILSYIFVLSSKDDDMSTLTRRQKIRAYLGFLIVAPITAIFVLVATAGFLILMGLTKVLTGTNWY